MNSLGSLSFQDKFFVGTGLNGLLVFLEGLVGSIYNSTHPVRFVMNIIVASRIYLSFILVPDVCFNFFWRLLLLTLQNFGLQDVYELLSFGLRQMDVWRSIYLLHLISIGKIIHCLSHSRLNSWRWFIEFVLVFSNHDPVVTLQVLSNDWVVAYPIFIIDDGLNVEIDWLSEVILLITMLRRCSMLMLLVLGRQISWPMSH